MVFTAIVGVLLLIFAPGYVLLCVPLGLIRHILKSVCKEQALKETTEPQNDFFGDEDEDILSTGNLTIPSRTAVTDKFIIM